MTTITFRVDNPDGGAFTASAIGHSIHTQADTIWGLYDSAREAAHLHFGRPVVVRFHPVDSEFVAEQMTINSLCGSCLPGEHPDPAWKRFGFEYFDGNLELNGDLF